VIEFVPLENTTDPPPSDRLKVAVSVTIRLAEAGEGEMDNTVVVVAGVGRAMAKLWSAEEPEATADGGVATGERETFTGVDESVVVPLPNSPRPLYPQP
jgi:hypothetical protein